MNLTAKQSLFVKEYLVDLNATQAAIRAGYSENAAAETGYENLRKPQIAAAISKAFQERSERIGKDALWVVERLIENAERCMQGVPVLDSDGDPTGEWRYEAQAANRALELLGRHFGAFDPRLKLPDLPKMESAADASKVMAHVTQAVADGRLSPEQGERFARIVEGYCTALDTKELQERIDEILKDRGN